MVWDGERKAVKFIRLNWREQGGEHVKDQMTEQVWEWVLEWFSSVRQVGVFIRRGGS